MQVPGFLALACLPFPFLFYKYGAGLRAKCKWTVKADKLLAAMMAGGQAEPKKEASQERPEAEENLEAALDAPVEEDVVLEVERDAESREGRPRQGSASDSSQQDTLAEDDTQHKETAKANTLKH